MVNLTQEEFRKLPTETESETFERKVKAALEASKGWKLSRKSLQIGQRDNGTSMMHEFDLVSDDGNIVGECKCYKWTEGRFYPSGKISMANETLFFLSRVNAKEKFLVLKEHIATNGQSLPDVYVRRV